MTDQEAALAEILLKEASDTTDPIIRRERIEIYHALMQAAASRRDASTKSIFDSANLATGIRSLQE